MVVKFPSKQKKSYSKNDLTAVIKGMLLFIRNLGAAIVKTVVPVIIFVLCEILAEFMRVKAGNKEMRDAN